MRLFLTVALIVTVQGAFAASAKFSWTQDPKSPAEAFRLHWRVKGSDEVNIIELGKVKPKDKEGTKYSLSMGTSDWVHGQEICFEMTSYNVVDNRRLESVKSSPTTCLLLKKTKGKKIEPSLQ